ncbi:MAG: SIS domain-containing protein [Actinobacteria bacterium]|nr:SIS domain-containing protein [Actinomycetota bacterium]
MVDEKINGQENEKTIFNEIQSQDKVWLSVVSSFLKLKKELIKIFDNDYPVYFIGSGSSYHAAIIAEFAFKELLDRKAFSIPSSEFLFYHKSYLKNKPTENIFILISRTGQTSDTLLAVDEIAKIGGYSVSLTSFPDSEITQKCNYSVILEHCQEKSITSTRAVTGFTAFFLCLFFSMAERHELISKLTNAGEVFFSKFNHYSDLVYSIVNKENFNRYIFLGHGPYYGAAREAALKVKEMSITNTEFWQTLEFRHGHNTTLDNNSLAVIFPSNAGIDYEIKTCRELKGIGIKILIICNSQDLNKLEGSYDYLIDMGLDLSEPVSELILQIFFQIFGQLIGYHQALKKGINPSNPRYLNYVITI